MQTVKIYRFQRNNKGVYQSARYSDGDYLGQILEHYNLTSGDNDHCPGPRRDSILSRKMFYRNIDSCCLYGSKWLFGFASRKSLLSWFSLECVEEMMELGDVELFVMELYVDAVIFSDKQCIFDKWRIVNHTKISSFQEAKKILLNS